jgi:cellulose synthase (UDP-forming)
LLYARDLHQAGYHYRDMVRIYALNLLLVPVNLAGVAKSLQQGITRTKIPFGRTPKVQGRTRIPRLCLVAELVLLALWSAGSAWDVAAARWGHAAFEAVNAGLLTYAVSRFIGWRFVVADLLARDSPPPRPIPCIAPEVLAWALRDSEPATSAV